MPRYNNALTTLQTRTIIDLIEKIDTPRLATDYDIEDYTFSAIERLEHDYPDVFPVDFDAPKADNPHFSYIAFTMAAAARWAVKTGDITVEGYLSILAHAKKRNHSREDGHRDFGAFGDLLEILVRCAFMRSVHLINWRLLTVKAVDYAFDIESRKYGRLDVGHNGKTLTHASAFDYMAGDYGGIVYGVFSDEDKEAVFSLCENRQIEKAMEYVCSYTVLWENKYQFREDMDNLTKGKGIALKGGNVQVVYNSGKYTAFVNALEEGKFVSLYDRLVRK